MQCRLEAREIKADGALMDDFKLRYGYQFNSLAKYQLILHQLWFPHCPQYHLTSLINYS
jgi:hypothetical protein